MNCTKKHIKKIDRKSKLRSVLDVTISVAVTTVVVKWLFELIQNRLA